jgi:hypothetical protein
MKNVIEFKQDLNIQTSYSRIDLGMHFNRMELKIEPSGYYGIIIWNYGKKAADEDETVIGLSFNENGELYDYDGVFELPKEAIQLLELNGYYLNADLSTTFSYVSDEELDWSID